MKAVTIALLLSLASLVQAAPKSCEELKGEIEAILKEKGASSYILDIVPNDEVKDQSKVVGSCDGGTQKIVYLQLSD